MEESSKAVFVKIERKKKISHNLNTSSRRYSHPSKVILFL